MTVFDFWIFNRSHHASVASIQCGSSFCDSLGTETCSITSNGTAVCSWMLKCKRSNWCTGWFTCSNSSHRRFRHARDSIAFTSYLPLSHMCSGDAFNSFKTPDYRLHFFESGTGLQFVMRTDPNQGYAKVNSPPGMRNLSVFGCRMTWYTFTVSFMWSMLLRTQCSRSVAAALLCPVLDFFAAVENSSRVCGCIQVHEPIESDRWKAMLNQFIRNLSYFRNIGWNGLGETERAGAPNL